MRDTREVKIGITNDPRRRLAILQTAHGERLELVAVVAGDAVDEQTLHARFAAHRKLGEWFHETPEITAWIREVQHGRE